MTTAQSYRINKGVADQIHELDDNVITCRDLRHAYAKEGHYRRVKVTGGVRGATYVERDRVCMRCPVKMRELYRVHSGWLERIRSYPVYPTKGYLLKNVPKGTNVIGMVRFEAFRRAMEEME